MCKEMAKVALLDELMVASIVEASGGRHPLRSEIDKILVSGSNPSSLCYHDVSSEDVAPTAVAASGTE